MKKLLFLIFSFFLVGCAGGPKASVEQDLQAKQFTTPTNNTSNLYIYRNELFASAIGMTILINGERIAVTGPKTYIMANLPSGFYEIVGIAPDGQSVLNIELLPNTNKFIWQEVKMGTWGARNKLQEVSTNQGEKGIRESYRLVNNYPTKGYKPRPEPISSQTDVYNKSSLFPYFSPKKIKSLSAKKTKKVKRTSWSACDCGYGYCYGPRGGRFCYTSGGNKSYR